MGSPSVAMGYLSQTVVAGLRWNQWQLSPGMGGRLTMESAVAFVWNGWQVRRGINGRFHLESVAALPWNTHCWVIPTEFTRGAPFSGATKVLEQITDVSSLLLDAKSA